MGVSCDYGGCHVIRILMFLESIEQYLAFAWPLPFLVHPETDKVIIPES